MSEKNFNLEPVDLLANPACSDAILVKYPEGFNKLVQEYLIENNLPINENLISSVKKAYELISAKDNKYEMLDKYRKPTTPKYYLHKLRFSVNRLSDYENELKNPIETKKKFFFFTVTKDRTEYIQEQIEYFKNAIEYNTACLEREVETCKRLISLNKMDLDIRNAVLEVKKSGWGYIEEK